MNIAVRRSRLSGLTELPSDLPYTLEKEIEIYVLQKMWKTIR